MATLAFVVLQITAILAIATISARYLTERSPQQSATVCMVGIVLAVMTIPLAMLPIPKFSVGILSIGSAQWNSPHEMDGRQLHPPEKQGGMPSSDAARSATEVGGGFNFLQVLSLWKHSTEEGSRASSGVLESCLAAWCLIAILGVMKLTMAFGTILQLKNQSHAYPNNRLLQTLQRRSKHRESLAGFQLRMSDLVKSPCVTWLDRTTIYLPHAFGEWSDDEQRAALAHEAAHLIRHDAQWRLMFDVLRAIVGFHPFARILKNQLDLAQEISADQEAGRLFSAEGYRIGLCKLALRMDAQPKLSHVSFGVSISTNSLVRRIKMLDFSRSRQLNRWQQFLAISLVATSGISVALCTTIADEPLRIASRVKKAKDPSPAFMRFTSQPWEEIGVQNGYFRVLPSVAAQRPMIKKQMDESAAAIGVGNLDCGIELSRDWISWTSNVDLKIKERDNDDHGRYSISILGDKSLIEFDREVDWAEVSEKVTLQTFAIDGNRAALKKFLAGQGQSKVLRMVSNNSANYRNYLVAKLLWPIIDGGVTAAVFPLEEVSKVNPEYKAGELPGEIAEIARKCSFAGIGVDFQDGESSCQVRLAIVPAKEYSAATIEEQVEIALATIRESMKENAESSERGNTVQASWRQELDTWRVSTQRASEELGEIVLIEGAISDASLLFPLM